MELDFHEILRSSTEVNTWGGSTWATEHLIPFGGQAFTHDVVQVYFQLSTQKDQSNSPVIWGCVGILGFFGIYLTPLPLSMASVV